MSKAVSTKPPSGFRDFIGEEAVRRLRLIQQISEVYLSYGFSALETPALENLDVLLGSGGQENEKLIFKTLKRGEKLQKELLEQSLQEERLADLGLRFDLTVPLCRVAAQYRDQISLPWKVFHIAPVWRAERAQRGRFREFIQCDVDIVGAQSIGAEAQVLRAVSAAFSACGLGSLNLRLNHRALIEEMAGRWGFGDHLAAFAILLDKKDKIEPEVFLSEMRDLRAKPLDSKLERVLIEGPSWDEVKSWGVADLAELETVMSTSFFESCEFDPFLARGMGYYTGTVFEVTHSEEGFALAGGGRYDQLIGRFMKQSLPAVGCSIGFERLLLLLEEKAELKSSQVFLPVMEEGLRPEVDKLAERLRALGLMVDVYADQAKLKIQMKYASSKLYRWLVILGPSELESGEFLLKDFTLSQEHKMPISEESLQRVKSLVLADR